MPKPREKESKGEFMSRCLKHSHIKKDFDSIEEGMKKCESLWKKHKGKDE